MVPPRVLITGFDPFGGQAVNPSWEAVQVLHGRTVAGHAIVAAQIPTVFGASLQALRDLLRQHKPTLVLATGQAGGRAAISLERVAINVNDARIPDNSGAQPIDTPVVPEAPAAYFTPGCCRTASARRCRKPPARSSATTFSTASCTSWSATRRSPAFAAG
jgi:pyroglutamyl-peptidase